MNDSHSAILALWEGTGNCDRATQTYSEGTAPVWQCGCGAPSIVVSGAMCSRTARRLASDAEGTVQWTSEPVLAKQTTHADVTECPADNPAASPF